MDINEIVVISGKGGTGKTSITGLLINYLATEKGGKVIAVDADANANLNEVLGEKIDITLGAIKEDVYRRERDGNSFPGGMTKAQYMKYRLSTAISEGDGYDLLVMGRSEGTGCYCYVNGILREQLDTISNSYDYLVIDNEAGMEHLSRGTSKSVDVLLLVSDCSRRSIQAVARIRDLALELKLKIGDLYLIVNKAPNGQLNDGIMEEINKYNLNLLGVVPMDDNIYEYDSNGKPLVDLPIDSPSKKTFHEILSNLNI